MAFDAKKNLRNRDLENEGNWLEYDEDTRFLVARNRNPKYKGFMSKSWRENEKILQSKTNHKKADNVADSFLLEATATYLLVGWEGVVVNGVEVEYSPELAIEILEEHDDIRAMIEEFAEVRENFFEKNDKRDAKNLGE